VFIATHFGWAIAKGLSATAAEGEMSHVALEFARSGRLADAFRAGQGLTAHVMPVTPILAGLIYRAFGPMSDVSEFILTGWSTSVALAMYLIAYRLFRAIGANTGAARIALLFALVFPLSLLFEASVFRVWEGALGALLSLIFLLMLVRYEANKDYTWKPTLRLGLVAAALIFVSPPLGIPAYLCALISVVTQQRYTMWLKTGLIATAALAIVLTPWVIRNEQAFGKFIPLRDNFGIEYAIGMNPGSVGTSDRKASHERRIAYVHPMHSDDAYSRMSRVGEYQYAKDWAQATNKWVLEHPGDAAQLMAVNAFEYFYSPPWLWSVENGRSIVSYAGGQMILHYTITTLALIAAVLFLRRGRWWTYLCIMQFGPVLTYMVTQPWPRYHYITIALEVFLAAELIATVLRHYADSRRGPSSVAATLSV
jgi:hypothetical protein